MTHRLIMPPMPIGTERVVFDITRLYRNRRNAFGTGVDRIDLAIGLDLARRFEGRIRFVLIRHGGFGELPPAAACALMETLDRRWHGGRREMGRDETLATLRGRAVAALGRHGMDAADATYVVASHSGLPQRDGWLDRFDPAGRMARAVYVHDLIPIEYPEYQTRRSTRVFTRYLEQVARRPATWFVNSADTGRRLSAYAEAQGWEIGAPIPLIPDLSPEEPEGEARPTLAPFLGGERPFHLIVGTIEPRKNHLLLLNIWREMARAGEAPDLVIAGRRGWMTENVSAMLDECRIIRPFVHEFGDLTDEEVAALMRAAKTLLFPSFAEGLGVPVLEARAAGLPVIASDLAAIREIAAPDAVFLDPLDGPGWRRAILSSDRSAG